MKKLFFLLFTINLFFVHGQTNFSLKGQVFDSLSSRQLEYVQVNLYDKFDSSLVGISYTNEKGRFVFNQLKTSIYFLKFTSFGYSPLYLNDINLNKNVVLPKITFYSSEAMTFDEIQIVERRDFIKNDIDKKVYNVEQDLSSRGASVSDVLNNVPSVDVDQEGAISLRGDANVTVLIDGRLSSLSGVNGTNLLSSIPASSIEKIEIISNPSSKYSPDGTSGIINIVMKKNKKAGLNIASSSTVANGPYFNQNAFVSLRNSKFNLYASYAFQNREGYRNYFGDLIRDYDSDSSTLLTQSREGTDLKRTHTVRFGSDFYLRNNQLIGMNFTVNQGLRKRTGDLSNKLFINDSSLLNNWTRTSIDPNEQLNMDLNVNYKKIFNDELGYLTFEASQSMGNDVFQGEYEELYYDLNGSLTSRESLNQQISNDENNQITTLQLDFSKELPKSKGRLEIGGKVISRMLSVKANSTTRDTLTNLFMNDGISDFDFKYTEEVYGLYSTFGQELGRLTYQFGGRVEQAYQRPNLVSENKSYINEYFKVYPSGHLKFYPKDNHEISLSYSKRVNRPTPRRLNPFTNYSDPFNLRLGNPALKPEFIDSYDLGYSYSEGKISISSSLYYRYTKDVIQRIRVYYPDNTSAIIFDNINNSYSQGAEVVFVFKPFVWWRNTLSINGSLIQYDGTSLVGSFNTNGSNLSVKYMGGVDFWKKTMSAQLNINYFAPRVVPQGIVQRRGSIDISLEKHLNDNWDIGLRVTDLLNRTGFYLDIRQDDAIQTAEYKWLTRRVYFTLSYKFGKSDMSKMKGKSTSDLGGDF
ncbi:MAG: TonB-dependent receptor domain-containing protein [Crocinitomicaceae bacterium]